MSCCWFYRAFRWNTNTSRKCSEIEKKLEILIVYSKGQEPRGEEPDVSFLFKKLQMGDHFDLK